TCLYVGAVDTTIASPGGWVAIHHTAIRAAIQLLPALWHDFTAVRRWSRTLSAISRCLDHKNSPSWSWHQLTGSSAKGDGGVGSKNRAAIFHGSKSLSIAVIVFDVLPALQGGDSYPGLKGRACAAAFQLDGGHGISYRT